MPDPEKERAELEKADRDIRDGEERISRQMLLIEELRRDGHDTAEAEKLLGVLQQLLATWKGHREAIRMMLADSRRRPRARDAGS